MRIDAKLPEGYVVLCGNQQNSHSFLVQNLGIAVECPRCGKTKLSVDLARDFEKGKEMSCSEEAA